MGSRREKERVLDKGKKREQRESIAHTHTHTERERERAQRERADGREHTHTIANTLREEGMLVGKRAEYTRYTHRERAEMYVYGLAIYIALCMWHSVTVGL